jgi:2,4-diketo-3-deoxy-L-fuconate hydrolase
MAINIVHFEYDNQAQWGILKDNSIQVLEGRYETTGAFIKSFPIDKLRTASKSTTASTILVSQVKLLSPVTVNHQFICQGANYRQHMIESGMDPDSKSFNMFFTKAPSCIVSAHSAVERPSFVKFLDYEIELGLVFKKVMNKPVKVTRDNLHEYIAGLVIVNDFSARDIQIPQMQFYKGKSYRTFGPVGPYLCMLEKEDIPLIHKLQLELTVNGQVRQSDSTANLVFGPEVTLTELSGMHDVDIGDLLATGTPAGCALSVPSPMKQKIGALLPEATKWNMFMKVQAQRTQYLKNGDVVRSRIRSACGKINLGEQQNIVVQSATL